MNTEEKTQIQVSMNPILIGVDAIALEDTADSEWYTPQDYIALARAVMGDIDLDPASTAMANKVVAARSFYAVQDDPLERDWRGRIWMYPPHLRKLIRRFCKKLAAEFRAGHVVEACVLVNNATETKWFQGLLGEASAICFPKGRIKFWNPLQGEAVPTQGQAVIYFGPNLERFVRIFAKKGFVCRTEHKRETQPRAVETRTSRRRTRELV